MGVNNKASGWQNITEENFKQPLNDIEVFKKIIDELPYAVTINSLNGTLIYANDACLKQYKINPGGLIGKYNIFQDPTINAAMPYEKIKRVLKGETVFFHHPQAHFCCLEFVRNT